MECNTEHQDPSRVTNQDESEKDFSQVNNEEYQNEDGTHRKSQPVAYKNRNSIIQGGSLKFGDKRKSHPIRTDDDFSGENGNGDDTPEEKLKYARLQTEGYQDEGYQESEGVSQLGYRLMDRILSQNDEAIQIGAQHDDD